MSRQVNRRIPGERGRLFSWKIWPTLPGPSNPFEFEGTYRGGPDTFLQVQRWEGGKWLSFPVPTKTDQSGQFTAFVELGQPGRYRLRVLDPDSGVSVENLCTSDRRLTALPNRCESRRTASSLPRTTTLSRYFVWPASHERDF